MPLLRAATPSAPSTSTPSITPHEQQLIDAGVNYLFPLDQGFVAAASLRNLGATSAPSGISWSVDANDFLIKTADVLDGVGTSWIRGWSSGAADTPTDAISFNNPVEMTAFSFGFTWLMSSNEIGWWDYFDSPSGGWNNSYVSMCKVGGVEFSYNRGSGTFYQFSGTGELWSRNIGSDARLLPYRCAATFTRNGNSQIYLNGARAIERTWNYDSQPSSYKGNGVTFGCLGTPSNGRWVAMRDFWVANRVMSTAELRRFSA